jgi:predicted TIM-barrel fold metal-dependent hydrolase
MQTLNRMLRAPAQPLPAGAARLGELLDLLGEAVPDVNTRRAILVRNPERLYGFA